MDSSEEVRETLPLDWGNLVIDEHATDDECDEEYTTIFWSDEGPD